MLTQALLDTAGRAVRQLGNHGQLLAALLRREDRPQLTAKLGHAVDTLARQIGRAISEGLHTRRVFRRLAVQFRQRLRLFTHRIAHRLEPGAVLDERFAHGLALLGTEVQLAHEAHRRPAMLMVFRSVLAIARIGGRRHSHAKCADRGDQNFMHRDSPTID